MALFVIADLHLSLNADKPMDVFHGWKNYVNRLEKNWRALVREEDTVVLAGDISWAMKLEDTLSDFSFLHSLPGRKILLKGNHDYWWSTKTKLEQFFSEHGFSDFSILHNCAYRVGDYVLCGTRGWLYNSETQEDQKIVLREVGRLKLSLEEGKKLGGTPLVFLHYPPVYDGMECKEILELLAKEKIESCYFGHIHGQRAAQKAPAGDFQGMAMHLISCDYVNFCPVRIE